MLFWKKKSSTPSSSSSSLPLSSLSPDKLMKKPTIIAVASGKGGVGKSTVATNLALAIKDMGWSVGLLDADFYGPSQPLILGQKKIKAKGEQGKILPPESHGIKSISIGHLLDEEGPVVWRAPMVTKLLQQLLTSVQWGSLDILLVDLPPGTGDIHITLAQQAQLSGAVIVTTPQDVAVDIARKGLMMFEQVNVPILGIVENMSGFICSHCHHETHIFPKKESVEHLAASHKTSVLGRIPLDPLCSYSSDEGLPLLIQHPNSIPAQAFKDTAVHLISTLLTQQEQLLKNKPQHVSLDESTGSLLIQWDEQHQGKWSAHSLRIQCPCAVCVDEHSGRRLLDPKTIPLDIRITNQSPIGQYGLSLRFSDKHSTGIYKWTMLKSCCECATCQASSASSSSQTFTV